MFPKPYYIFSHKILKKHLSRVVVVTGRAAVVNQDALFVTIDREIRHYDLISVSESSEGLARGFVRIELEFGSFRAQAHSAYVVLNRALRNQWGRVTYGVIPVSEGEMLGGLNLGVSRVKVAEGQLWSDAGWFWGWCFDTVSHKGPVTALGNTFLSCSITSIHLASIHRPGYIASQ